MNKYVVLVVGGRGAGKTVYLASLFRRLSVFGSQSFTLETDLKSQKILNEVYQKLASADDWPPATKHNELNEIVFDVRVMGKNGRRFTACQFAYYDYAGGKVDNSNYDSNDFQELLERADCVLGIVDGKRLHDFVHKIDPGGDFEYNQLANVCQTLQHTSAPCHILVTKWDVFQNSTPSITFDDTRRRLFENEQFKGLVLGKSRAGTNVRLIPVSSVGAGFAISQKDGSMRKTGEPPKPFQVEMPLACILPDRVEQELRRIIKEREALNRQPVSAPVTFSFMDRLRQVLGGTARVVPEILPSRFQYGEKILRRLAENIEKPVEEKRLKAREREEEMRAELESALGQIESERSALDYAIECFQRIELELVATFPTSSLGTPRT